MIQLEKVNKYIEDLKFKKKTMGGVDELDALNHMKNICDMYEEELNRLKSGETSDGPSKEELTKKDEIIDTLKEKLKQINDEKEKYKELAMENSGTENNSADIERKDRELNRLKTDNERLISQNSELETSVRKAEQELRAANEQKERELQQVQAVKDEYEKKYNEIKELSEYIPQIKKDAQERAEVQASQIIVQANIDAQAMREESILEKQKLQGEIDAIKQAKDDMKRSMLGTMQKYDELLKQIQTEMENE